MKPMGPKKNLVTQPTVNRGQPARDTSSRVKSGNGK